MTVRFVKKVKLYTFLYSVLDGGAVTEFISPIGWVLELNLDKAVKKKNSVPALTATDDQLSTLYPIIPLSSCDSNCTF